MNNLYISILLYFKFIYIYVTLKLPEGGKRKKISVGQAPGQTHFPVAPETASFSRNVSQHRLLSHSFSIITQNPPFPSTLRTLHPLRPLTLLDPNKQIAVEAAKQLPCSIFAWLGLAFSPLLYSRTQKNFTFDLTCAIQESKVLAFSLIFFLFICSLIHFFFGFMCFLLRSAQFFIGFAIFLYGF